MNSDSIGQETLPFKLGVTSEIITSRSGLAVFHEAALASGVVAQIRRHLPAPCSNRGIKPEEYVMPLVLMLTGGGQTMEDIREIENDTGLRRLCGFRHVPGADAIGIWLKAAYRIVGMRQVNEYLCRRIIAGSKIQEFTLDIDATLIETEKRTAEKCYKGFRAFAPLLSFLSELGLCVVSKFRNGDVPAGVGIEQQLRQTHKLLKPLGKMLRYLRSDSAGYQADVINACRELGVTFTITADHDAAVKKIIKRASEESGWTRIFNEEGKPTEREYKTAIHCMGETEAFTLIIQRYPNLKPDLFHPEFYRYYVIATNDDARNTKEVIEFHNGRGNAENYNKELKSGFGMEYAPCQNLKADGVWLELGVLAHNLAVAVKRLLLGDGWETKTIGTLRWELIFIAGRVVAHGRELWLRVGTCYYELLKGVREKLKPTFFLTPT